VAGQPAYSVRAALKRNSGLFGGLEFAWDAATGTPLRGGIYAKGEDDPVLALEATEIAYGAVPDETFEVPPPTEVRAQDVRPHRGHGRHEHRKPIKGERRVERKLGFDVSAPRTLEGRKRQVVALAGRAAVVTYGRSLNGIAVVQKRVSAEDDGHDPLDNAELPAVDVNGAAGERLSTPLGTVLRFERDGIRYIVIASAEPSVVEAAARAL
jgi:hypothetical protein